MTVNLEGGRTISTCFLIPPLIDLLNRFFFTVLLRPALHVMRFLIPPWTRLSLWRFSPGFPWRQLAFPLLASDFTGITVEPINLLNLPVLRTL